MSDDLRDILRRIKESMDIVEVIGRSVHLKRTGATYKGLCPFHKEKTPSFNVVPAKGIFHCFGCGQGGSVIDFVMRTERLEFLEAVEKLAAELGIEFTRGRPRDPVKVDAEKRLINAVRQANEEALKWFRRNLLENRNPLAADYLPERGIAPEISERFQLGAALDSWDALKEHLIRLGFTEDTLVEAGLCVRADGGRVYDRFRHRLIFPILDHNGRVCGFGGRQLVKDEKSPKYLNSAETVLYKKSHILYGLNLAKDDIDRTGYSLICEGYMDVIIAHVYGHTQAVASLGTALTREQARLLKRFAGKAFFLYDGDSAGQRAMLRGGEPLLEADFDTRVVCLPPDDDPDTFLRREGTEALGKLLDNADEFIDFALRVHGDSVDTRTLAGQAELVERMAPVLNAFRNEVMREGALTRVLKRLGGLPREAVQNILRRKVRQSEQRYGEAEAPAGGPEKSSGSSPQPVQLERHLLKAMIESHAALEVVRSLLLHDWIADSPYADWIFYLNDHEGYCKTLLDSVEASQEFPGEPRVLFDVMAWDAPLTGCTADGAEQILLRLQERHQHRLTQELLSMIDRKELAEEDTRRLLAAFHQEGCNRIRTTGSRLRVKDAAARSRRFGRGYQ